MSYILDALRKAEAERERGNVPHLMAQPLGTPPPVAAPRRGALWGAGAALALVAAVGAGWWLARQNVPAQGPAPEATPTATSPANSGTAPAPAIATTAPVPSPTTPGAPSGLAALDPTPRPPRPAADTGPVAAPPPAPPAVDGAAAPPAATRPAPGRTVAYDQLPPDVRRQLPVLSLGGAIYSETPSARMLLVNGQLQREGDHVAPGVVLEQIQPRSAVLRWRDLRYEMSW
ncbi:MAG: general secretion pathway protein GspB [Betaproteobacteria bacterium]